MHSQLFKAPTRRLIEETFLLSSICSPMMWSGNFVVQRDCLIRAPFEAKMGRQNFASIPEVEDVLAFEPREFIPAGDKVAVLGWERSQARSGKVFESEWVHIFTVRDGRIVRFWGMYDTQASAEARG
jgi:ketosteroid isomerase-like protein